MKGYTHLAKIYGFRCHYNVNTNELKGINWYSELMIDLFIWIDVTFQIQDGFYIKIIKEY